MPAQPQPLGPGEGPVPTPRPWARRPRSQRRSAASCGAQSAFLERRRRASFISLFSYFFVVCLFEVVGLEGVCVSLGRGSGVWGSFSKALDQSGRLSWGPYLSLAASPGLPPPFHAGQRQVAPSTRQAREPVLPASLCPTPNKPSTGAAGEGELTMGTPPRVQEAARGRRGHAHKWVAVGGYPDQHEI